MIFLIMAIALLASDPAAQEHVRHKQVSCWTVLSYVWIYGEEAVISWAKKNGYTAAQIDAIKRTCGKV
jgi:hypothetical protein